MLQAQVFTLYPEIFPGPLNKGLYGKALINKVWNLKVVNILVEEMPTGEIALAAGFGTAGGSIGGGLKEKNFLGKGINLNTNIEFSESMYLSKFNPINIIIHNIINNTK